MAETAVTVHLDRSIARLAAPRACVLYEGRVARTHRRGDALRYPWGEEHRDADELANLVAQLPGKPVVAAPKGNPKHRPGTGHPADLIKLGAEHEVVGQILGARIDGDDAVAQILIWGTDTLEAIENGDADELSLGYTCRADEQGFQRGTYVDHLSVVPHARCGASCALRADEGEARVDCGGDETCACRSSAPVAELDASQNPESMRTSHVDQGSVQGSTCKIRAIGHNSEISAPGAEVQMNELEKKIAELTAQAAAEKVRADQAEAALKNVQTRADQAEKDRDAARVEASNAKKDLAGETARADQAETEKKTAIEKARTDAAEAQSAAVTKLVKLISDATPIIGTDAEGKPVDLLAMSERDIKVAVVKHVDGDEIGPDESPEFVNGMYVGALKRFAKVAGSRSDARKTIVGARRDAETSPKTSRDAEQAALAAMNHETATAYLGNR